PPPGHCRLSLPDALPISPLGEVVVATRDGRLGDGMACEVADLDQPGTLAGLVARIAPDVVVNAAAHTQVDKAESEPEAAFRANRSEEHTSELQSRENLVC